MAGEWQNAVTEARETTGFTGEVVPRTVEGIGAALRIDRRTEFYAELGALGDPGGFEAFLNHWWTQALADSAPDEDAHQPGVVVGMVEGEAQQFQSAIDLTGLDPQLGKEGQNR